MRVRVKICGITRIEDALACVDAGADALGFVFHEKSARFVTPERARSIVAALPPFVTTVGVFLDAETETVCEIARIAGIEVAQFHGDEPAEACDAVGMPYVKTIPVCASFDAGALDLAFPRASGILLDTAVGAQRGGTGTAFDWRLWPKESHRRLILAGGLGPANVARAIEVTKPYAVDVCTGVESTPGKKDADKVRAFIAEVARASEGQ